MKNNSTATPSGDDKQPKQETASELAHRHLLDPNHVTTDEELRNVSLEFRDEDAEKQLDEAAKADGVEIENDDDEDKLPGEKDIVVTPWNLSK